MANQEMTDGLQLKKQISGNPIVGRKGLYLRYTYEIECTAKLNRTKVF